MNIDHDQPPPHATATKALQTLTSGPLSSSVAKLAASSRCIPSERDFYFYRNFQEFKVPVDEINKESQSMLDAIGAAAQAAFPIDVDDAYDWLVNVNDDVLERFDLSADEFRRVREEEEKTGRVNNDLMVEDGFELVCGKKKKAGRGKVIATDSEVLAVGSGVKVAMKDKKAMGAKPKIPFHIPTIKKPQEEYGIMINNANMPFEHVWLQRSEDGQRFIHPLEKLSVQDFVDKEPGDVVPQKPPSIESTPFKLVEEVKDLKELAAKLRSVNEFAVDLEHNQYRSFQGLTCLMQISTRTEDFVVDTLKLRVHIGPHLREVFKDPSKRKVMHGADRDILWLQRDFGIYICNLFDTGQASKVLKLERNSLEYLLHHFCEVTANKEYQNADWRLRPLPEEMIRYAREDTHYLLYVYDSMRINLFSLPKMPESSDTPLAEVYKRSYDVCTQLYEKELLTENSYLHIYGLQGADFNAQQLAIVSGLCEWRDIVARAEDESTGYVLPNKSVLEIAKQMPFTPSKLRRLVKSKHPYVEHNLDTVVSIIRHSVQNAPAFEAAAQQLKVPATAATVATASDVVLPVTDGAEDPLLQTQNLKESFQHQDTDVQIKLKPNSLTSQLPRDSLIISEQNRDANIGALSTLKENVATVQVLKKPAGAFGAMLGNSASKRKLGPVKGKEEIKLEQIRSSVTLPFHSFLGSSEKSKPVVESPSIASEMSTLQKPVADPVSTSALEEIIMLESDTVAEDMEKNNLDNLDEPREKSSSVSTSENEDEDEDEDDEPTSLSELSSNFQKCFQSNNQNIKIRQPKKTEQPGGVLQLKAFDYEAAREQVKFGERTSTRGAGDGRIEKKDSGGKKRSALGQEQPSDLTKQLQQGRRRQAFPASGNRSATFR